MKQLFLRILSYVAAFCVVAPVFVSGGDAPEGRQGRRGAMGARLDEALGKLNLTADQKTRIETVKARLGEYLKAHAEELKAAREETDPDKKREAMKGLFEQFKQMREDIRAVLTDDQKKQFDELLPARRGAGSGKPGSGQ